MINFVILCRKYVLMIKVEVNYCIINVIIMFEGDEDCIYYNNEVDKFWNDFNDVYGILFLFDDFFYNMIDIGGNYL